MRRVLLALLAIQMAPASGWAQQHPLLVSVAASLGDVVSGLGPAWAASGEAPFRVNVGGSNAIARQIVEGAAVDVFISADEHQMDVVERAGRLVTGTRAPLVGNRLVVVTAVDVSAKPTSADALADAGVRRIAMGQPDSVPAGVYGRAWLERLGLWGAVRPKVVPMPTVRAALAAAREGRVDAAIVYASDARSEPAVTTAFAVTGPVAPEIVYPSAAIDGGHEEAARRFLAFLRGPAARRAFERAGFVVLARPSSDH